MAIACCYAPPLTGHSPLIEIHFRPKGERGESITEHLELTAWNSSYLDGSTKALNHHDFHVQ